MGPIYLQIGPIYLQIGPIYLQIEPIYKQIISAAGTGTGWHMQEGGGGGPTTLKGSVELSEG